MDVLTVGHGVVYLSHSLEVVLQNFIHTNVSLLRLVKLAQLLLAPVVGALRRVLEGGRVEA